MPANSIREIKRRIKSVKSIEHITNAMKLVSSAKLRRAKNVYEKTNKYLADIMNTIEEILSYTCKESDDMAATKAEKTCYIVITSNGGLCGSFSANVIKRTLEEIDKDIKSARQAPVIVAIGNKGREYFGKRGYEIISDYIYSPEDISYEEAQELCIPFIRIYAENKIDKIVIIYNSFIDSLLQKVSVKTLLPYESSDKDKEKENKYIEYEPSAEEVFEYIVPKYAEIALYRAVIESATCEHAARRIAMENATDNARDMISELSLEYNSIRQAAITNEISEIVRGSEALK